MFAGKVLTPMLFQAQVGMNAAFLGSAFGWLVAVSLGIACAWMGIGEVLKEEFGKTEK